MGALGWSIFGAGFLLLWLALTGRPVLGTLAGVLRGQSPPPRSNPLGAPS